MEEPSSKEEKYREPERKYTPEERRGKEGHSSFPVACLGSERTLLKERGPTEAEVRGKAGTD
jgi:hypothetical protein